MLRQCLVLLLAVVTAEGWGSISNGTDAWTTNQLCARHEKLEVIVRDRLGAGVVYAPGTGGGQGDKVMPVQFRRF